MTLISAPAFADQRLISISAVGDIMMGTTFPSDRLPMNDGQGMFRIPEGELLKSDVRYGNLEGPLYDGDSVDDGKAAGANRYIFRTPTRYGQYLKQAGFNALGMANNHAKDFGIAGFDSTKRTLRNLGLQYSSKSGEVAQLNVRGTRVALIAVDFYPGARSMTTPESTYREIQNLKRQFDIVIVAAHAGGEGENADHVPKMSEFYLGENRGNSVDFAHTAIENGADLILMSGPHVPRGLEIHRNRLIVYSLGNFMTEKGISIAGKSALAPILTADLDSQGRFVKGHLSSYQQTRTQGIVLDPSQRALALMQELSESDFPQTQPHFLANGDLQESRGTLP